VSAANGFANRHLLIHVTRSKWLPDQALVTDLRPGLIAHQLRPSVHAAERREVTCAAVAAGRGPRS
jgi:hypothetical protein